MTTSSLDNPESVSHDARQHFSLPMWLPIVGIFLGLILVCVSLYVDEHLCSNGLKIVFCIGAALILSGFGTQASGKWKNFSIAGAGAIALLIFGFVYVQHPDVSCAHRASLAQSAKVQGAGTPVGQTQGGETQGTGTQGVDSRTTDTPSEGIPSMQEEEIDGWVYIGSSFGLDWGEKFFKWDGKSLPQKGATLTATGSVHLRRDHIRYRQNEGWVNSKSIGIINPDDKFEVLEIKTIADGFHWVKVRKIKSKKEE